MALVPSSSHSSGGTPEVEHGNGPPVDGTNARFYLVIDDPDPYVGTIKLTFGGQETGAINLATETGNDAAALLEALSTIGAGNIVCISGETDTIADNGSEWDFEFVGDLAAQPVGAITVTSINATANGVAMNSGSFDNDSDAGAPADPDAQLYINDDVPALYMNEGGVWTAAITQGGPLTENLAFGVFVAEGTGGQLNMDGSLRLDGTDSAAGDGQGAELLGGDSTVAGKSGAEVLASGATPGFHGKIRILTNNSRGTAGQVLTADGNGNAVWV